MGRANDDDLQPYSGSLMEDMDAVAAGRESGTAPEKVMRGVSPLPKEHPYYRKPVLTKTFKVNGHKVKVYREGTNLVGHTEVWVAYPPGMSPVCFQWMPSQADIEAICEGLASPKQASKRWWQFWK